LVFSWMLVYYYFRGGHTYIYREDLHRVTASRNRLGLSLSKRIRHAGL
jgi:hypothetical protein